ncbi:transglutaminaseTgpA domain-containing protein [uncultured Jatrophihabitans sp.]|uniref:transglutaminase family protein n=1 Tax=uncultured Jatrophihabitans sp. TaxID=1610747 RepID=UPI0035CB3ADD
MTASYATRPAGREPAEAKRPVRPARRPSSWATRRTLLALLASALGAVPLKGLLSDDSWLLDVWFAMALVIAPAALLRLRRPPGALDIWPGVLLLVPWLTARFVPGHALLGMIPTSGTWHDLQALMTSLHHTTHDGVAPVHSTPAVRLVLCALLGLLAALVDLIAVVGRRGALAGAPLLVVYTIAGAVPRTPVAWAWFAAAAAGFLLLLAVNADDELERWGRRIPRPDGAVTRLSLPVSAPRIALVAILVAVILPLAVPAHPRNILANAFHNAGGSGSGSGSGSGRSISPYVDLKGQLTRDKPTNLMTVDVLAGSAKVPPFYLRTNVLDQFTGSGWRVSDHGSTEDAQTSDFPTDPPSTQRTTRLYEAKVSVTNLDGNAPVFSNPLSFTGLAGGTTWSPRDGLLLGKSVGRGDTFVETFAQPAPDAAELANAIPASACASGCSENPDGLNRWLAVPTLPTYARDLVRTLTAGKANDYAKARAISDYFANPDNGFQYSLTTKKGDSGSDLVDFLKNKTGYCQQYAGAMGVMLREAGIPARVVLGYMHDVPDKSGEFTITSFDAHSWVEAYFGGIGWVPFDPTPVEGLNGGSQSDLGYAPHDYPSGASNVDPGKQTNSASTTAPAKASSSASSAAPAKAGSSATGSAADLAPLWVSLGVLLAVLLALTPAGLRLARRRRRLAAGRLGDPDALWAELSDTAVDLGYVWSRARSPRQVAAWLADDAGGGAELTALAAAVERRRFAPPEEVGALGAGDPASSRSSESSASSELTRELTRATSALRSGRAGRVRLRARLWPASLRVGATFQAAGRRRH